MKKKDLSFTICLQMKKGFVGKFIAWFSILYWRLTKKNIDQKKNEIKLRHMYLKTLDNYGFESTFPWVRIMTPKIIKKIESNKKNRIIYVKVKNTTINEMIKASYEIVNEYTSNWKKIWYPLPQLLGMTYVLIRLIFTLKKVKNPWGKNAICSELILNWLKKLKNQKKEFENENQNDFTPFTFYKKTINNLTNFEYIAEKKFGDEEITYEYIK